MSTTIARKLDNVVAFVANDRTAEDRTDRAALRDIQSKWIGKLMASFEDSKPLSISDDKRQEISQRVDAIIDILEGRGQGNLDNPEAYFPQAEEYSARLADLMSPEIPEFLNRDLSEKIRAAARSDRSGKNVAYGHRDLSGQSSVNVGKFAERFGAKTALERAVFEWVYADAGSVGVLVGGSNASRRKKAREAFVAACFETADEVVKYVDRVMGHRMQLDEDIRKDARVKRGVMPGVRSAGFRGGVVADVEEAIGRGIAKGGRAAVQGIDPDMVAGIVAATVDAVMKKMKMNASAVIDIAE